MRSWGRAVVGCRVVGRWAGSVVGSWSCRLRGSSGGGVVGS